MLSYIMQSSPRAGLETSGRAAHADADPTQGDTWLRAAGVSERAPQPRARNRWLASLCFLGAIALMAIPEAHAQVAIQGTAVPCWYCTDTQMREAVVWRGPGTHYVSDIPGGVLRRYTVTCGTGGQIQGSGEAGVSDEPAIHSTELPADQQPEAFSQSWCTGPANVASATVEPAALEQFQLVRQVWVDTDGTFTKTLDVTYDDTGLFWNPRPGSVIAPNAYDVLDDVNFRGMLGSALVTTRPAGFNYVETVAAWIGAMINAYAGQTDGLRIVIQVVFSNGSSVVYEYRYGDPSATYRAGSARTPGGQVIPDPEVANSPSGGGYWGATGPNGAQEDLEAFLDYMRRRGVEIVRGESTRIRGVRCEWVGPNRARCTTT